jgi:hypothetical protein
MILNQQAPMTHRARRIAPASWLALLGLLTIGQWASAADESRQVRILAIIPAEDEPPRVVLITEWEYSMSTLAGGMLPALINDAKVSKRNDPLDAQLRKTLEGYERTPILADAVKRGLEKPRGVFQVTTTTDGARYFQAKGKDKLTAAAAEEFDYVLLMNSEFVGLWMAGALTRTDDVTPAQAVRFRLLRASDSSSLSGISRLSTRRTRRKSRR